MRLKKGFLLVMHHLRAAWYAITVALPIILRTGRRPVIFNKWSGIGDIICTFPAVIELKKRHPNAAHIYNCHPEYTCLPKLGGITDKTTSFPDVGVVGYWYRFLLAGYYNFASDDDKPEVTPTDVYIKDFGRSHGVAVGEMHPCLDLSEENIREIHPLLAQKGISDQTMVVIHPGPSWPVREWPLDHWKTLVSELHQNGLTNVVQLGVAKHLALGEIAQPEIPGTVSLVDQLTLEQTVTLISQASLFIGIDSGLLHIAAATRTPAVGLWGPTSPHLRFCGEIRKSFITSNAACQGCHHRHPRLHWMTDCPKGIACMKTISVNEVMAACLSQVGKLQ
ncbi:MAG: glycosyltransferase family 9 protein [Chthoniobacteraceae bacterium]